MSSDSDGHPPLTSSSSEGDADVGVDVVEADDTSSSSSAPIWPLHLSQPRVRRFSGWRSTSSVCESSTSSVCFLKLGSAQCSGNCADVAADDDDADVVLRAGVGSSSIFRIPCPKCDHGSFSPLAITDRSIAHPSLLLRSGIALACAPPLAISDRPHHYGFIIYRSTFHHHLVSGRSLIP